MTDLLNLNHPAKTIINNSILFNDDCFNILPYIQNQSVNLILCDLPYGSTNNKWDTQLPLDQLWAHYERIITPNGAIVLFAQTPFDKILGASNIKLLKYEYIWNKKRPTGHLNSHFAPMKQHENILVFSKASACFVKDKSKAMTFNPQFSKGKPYTALNGKAGSNYNWQTIKQVITVNDGNYYPTSILEFTPQTGLHSTQKPLPLLEYLVKTYSNQGDTVLDNCMGSNTTGFACQNLGRQFIGIEKDTTYYNIAIKRVCESLLLTP